MYRSIQNETMHASKTNKQKLFDLCATLSNKTDWFILGMTDPYEYRRQMSGCLSKQDWDRLFQDKERKKTLAQLRKKKWLKDNQEGERVAYEIQHHAVVACLKSHIIASDKQLQENSLTFVIFDVPEAAKSSRIALRRFLKEAGFKQKQLSVWVSTKDVAHEMRQLIQLLNMEKWVEVYVACLVR